MIKLRPYSSTFLILCGMIMTGIGLYFAFLRPALLPEDVRYIGVSLTDVETAVPHLTDWLHRVFVVMGGYIVSSGLLTTHVAFSAFRQRTTGIGRIMAVVGFTSIGWMVVINFVLASDFRWVLLGFAILWTMALTLYWIERRPEVSRDSRAFP